jgi:hypothetical protein
MLPDDLAETLTRTGLGFALVDGVRNRAAIEAVRASDPERARSVLVGRRNSDLDACAPHLLWLPMVRSLAKEIVLDAASESECVFLEAQAPFAEVARHLRRQLVVESEDGSSKLFRFFDPAILRTYLPTLSERESSRFFGPITSFYIVTRGARSLVPYARRGRHQEAQGKSWPLPLIRKEQETAFSNQLIDEFVARMVERFRGVDPFSTRAAREEIVSEMSRAAGYGIGSARTIERWLELVVKLGRAFDERHPWVRHELSKEASEERRLLRIETRLRRDRLLPAPRAMS